jgi:UPF0755 protein
MPTEKKRNNSLLIIGVLCITAVIGAWLFAGPATVFPEKSRKITIKKFETNKSIVLANFKTAGILRFTALLGIAGAPINLWDNIKPGTYEIKSGESIIDIIRLLKRGRSSEIKLVLNKVRTKEELTKLICKTFPLDSTSVFEFISSDDSLSAFNTNANKLFTNIIPNTYIFYADATINKIIQKLINEGTAFWLRDNRIGKVQASGMTKEEIYTLASIVEEETNFDSDKYKIASVYINRLKKQMPLQACPTIKYAMNDFAITRIYEKYLTTPSPFNTYINKGLPPGPICTPSPKTIDIVLNAPKTDYIYFVAKSDFSGYHHFSSSYEEHTKYANEYQKELDAHQLKKQQEKK